MIRKALLLPLIACISAGCPLDPETTVDYTRRPDPRVLLDNVGCSPEAIGAEEIFYDSTCSPVLHPLDLAADTWESWGIYDFDVEPVMVFGGTFHRIYYTAGGDTHGRATGLADTGDGTLPDRHWANPLVLPEDGEDKAQFACTAIDNLTGAYHAWMRRDDGDLYHAISDGGVDWEIDEVVRGMTSESGLTQVLSCDAWFVDGEVEMLVGGRFGDDTYAIGQTVTKDGVLFNAVEEPVFQASEETLWQSGGIGYPSLLTWNGREYLFHIGATGWDETVPLFPDPLTPTIGLAARDVGDTTFELLIPSPVPGAFDDAAPTRVRIVHVGEWALMYVRDLYYGPKIVENPQNSLGLMLISLPELEGAS